MNETKFSIVELIGSTNLSPRGKRVVIERLQTPERSRGGLFVLGREYPALGRVLHMSFKAYFALAQQVVVGDLVYYDRTKTELRSIPGEPEHFVLDVEDLFVRIREEDE